MLSLADHVVAGTDDVDGGSLGARETGFVTTKTRLIAGPVVVLLVRLCRQKRTGPTEDQRISEMRPSGENKRER